MRELWMKLRPHLLAWHMLPCLLMLGVATGVAVATGRAAALIPAVACMAMVAAMMSMMGGHDRHRDRDRNH
jgi:hypothetical protein